MDLQVSIISIILILAFYLPGYFFRKFYYSGFSTKQVAIEEWYNRFFKSIFYGMVIQFITAKILRDNFHFNFDTISSPLNQVYTNITKDKLPDLDYTNFRNTILYLMLSMTFASIFGLATRNLVRLTKLDVLSPTFRYANIWHYYFRGDILKTNDFKGIAKKGKWLSTRADILVDFEKDEKNILYTGIISQYDLSHKSDKLERVYLTGAQRYSTKEGSAGFKTIPGDILILDCSRILNINLSYDFIQNNQSVQNKIGITIFKATSGVIIFSPFLIIPYYFFGSVGIIRTVLGMFESLGIIILLLTSVSIIFTKEEKFSNKYKSTKTATLSISVFITILFCFLFYFTLKHY